MKFIRKTTENFESSRLLIIFKTYSSFSKHWLSFVIQILKLKSIYIWNVYVKVQIRTLTLLDYQAWKCLRARYMSYHSFCTIKKLGQKKKLFCLIKDVKFLLIRLSYKIFFTIYLKGYVHWQISCLYANIKYTTG